MTCRAEIRNFLNELIFKPLIAFFAEGPGGFSHLYGTAFNFQGLPMDQCIGYFSVGRRDYSPEGLPGYIHPASRVFLVEALEIGEFNRFKFIESDNDLFKQ